MQRRLATILSAVLPDPDNINMKYNFACMFVIHLHDQDAALDLLEKAEGKENTPGERSHVHIDGHVAIREERHGEWVIHVMPRVRKYFSARLPMIGRRCDHSQRAFS